MGAPETRWELSLDREPVLSQKGSIIHHNRRAGRRVRVILIDPLEPEK